MYVFKIVYGNNFYIGKLIYWSNNTFQRATK